MQPVTKQISQSAYKLSRCSLISLFSLKLFCYRCFWYIFQTWAKPQNSGPLITKLIQKSETNH